MTFSVIIPCYNCVSTLETTVGSVRGCGLTDYEIILIDDGSSDGTAELCDSLSSSFDEVRCLHQQNAGVSAARNRGIAEAEGEYIWFVDADDLVEPMNMEPIKQAVSDGTDCIMFGMKFLHEWHGRLIMEDTLSCGSMQMLTCRNLGMNFRMLFDKNYFTTMCNKFIRKSIVSDNKLEYDKSLINYEDLHFCLTILKHCNSFLALPETYYHYINAFGHDRTVDRIKRVPDIIAYTDKVVAPFYVLNNTLCKTGSSPIEGLSEIVLRLYMEAAYFKLKTADKNGVKQLCNAVQNNENMRREAHSINKMCASDQRLYQWMMNNSYGKIHLFMLYRALRSVGSRVYRIGRSYLGI